MSYALQLHTAHQARRQRLMNTLNPPIPNQFKSTIIPRYDQVFLNKVLQTVSQFTGYAIGNIVGKCHCTGFVEARNIFAYMANVVFGISVKKIAKRLKKTRSVVFRYIQSMKERIKADSNLAYDVSRMRMVLK